MELLFDVFDKNEDAYLSQGERGSLLSAHNISPMYANEVFPPLSQSGEGRLTKKELAALVYDFHYSDDPSNPANSMFAPY